LLKYLDAGAKVKVMEKFMEYYPLDNILIWIIKKYILIQYFDFSIKMLDKSSCLIFSN